MSKADEVVIIIAKCPHANKTYGMRSERIAQDAWRITWAFPIKESTAHNEGYDKTAVSGSISFSNDYPGCPYCHEKLWIQCNSCGRLSCYILKNGLFTCTWCRSKGQVEECSRWKIAAGTDAQNDELGYSIIPVCSCVLDTVKKSQDVSSHARDETFVNSIGVVSTMPLRCLKKKQRCPVC